VGRGGKAVKSLPADTLLSPRKLVNRYRRDDGLKIIRTAAIINLTAVINLAKSTV